MHTQAGRKNKTLAKHFRQNVQKGANGIFFPIPIRLASHFCMIHRSALPSDNGLLDTSEKAESNSSTGKHAVTFVVFILRLGEAQIAICLTIVHVDSGTMFAGSHITLAAKKTIILKNPQILAFMVL